MNQLPQRTSALIIGGGPSGLVALKYALETTTWAPGAAPILLEAQGEIASSLMAEPNRVLKASSSLLAFSDYRLSDALDLAPEDLGSPTSAVSSALSSSYASSSTSAAVFKETTTDPGRFPLTNTTHMTAGQYATYLNAYATAHNLEPNIHTGARVVCVQKSGGAAYPHIVTVRSAAACSYNVEELITIAAHRIVVATGAEKQATPPRLLVSAPPEGQWYPEGQRYRERVTSAAGIQRRRPRTSSEPGKDKEPRRASHHTVTLRKQRSRPPHKGLDLGVFAGALASALVLQRFLWALFKDLHSPRAVAARSIRWLLRDSYVRHIIWLMTGLLAQVQASIRAESPREKRWAVGHVVHGPFHTISRLFSTDAEPKRVVHRPRPVHYADNRALSFPLSSARPIMPKQVSWSPGPTVTRRSATPAAGIDFLSAEYVQPSHCDARGICDSSDLSVGYIGFVPSDGTGPALAEMQGQFFFLLSQGRMPLPTSGGSYHVPGKPEVLFTPYVAQLAADMGTLPSLLELVGEYGWFVALVYCFGPDFPSVYRLVGPYRSPKASTIVRTELWNAVWRRGVVLSLIPLVGFFGRLRKLTSQMFYILVGPLVFAVIVVSRLAGWDMSEAPIPSEGYLLLPMDDRRTVNLSSGKGKSVANT